MNQQTLVIDGSQGEGGGQILRTSIALAAALGKAVRIVNIRARRSPPGLRPQHLMAVRAAATVCQASVEGDHVDSRELTFRPGHVQPGQYSFDIGTAGSTTLVLQTLIPALVLADGDSSVSVTGGTHNPFAPSFEYLRDVFGVLASTANVQAYFEMPRAGFYPAGGGEVTMQLAGLELPEDLAPIRLTARGELKYIEGISATSEGLPSHIAERQATEVLSRLVAAGYKGTMEQAAWRTDSPGTAVFVRAVFTQTVAGFFALGKRGKPAEQVADEAVDQLLEFLNSQGVVDRHAADQLITLAALCPHRSEFVSQCLTEHMRTNAAVVTQLTGRQMQIEGLPSGAARVILHGA